MKIIKKLCSMLLVICVCISITPQMASAAHYGNSIRVKRVSVDFSENEVDVKFATPVMWKYNAKVKSIRDDKGKSYRGYLVDKDKDDCEIFINKMKTGRTYTIKISGVKAYGSTAYKTITVTAKAAAQGKGLSVKKVKYDADYDDGRMEYTVSFDFNKRVHSKHNSYVIVKDAKGKAYSSHTSYVEWDGDDCEVHLSHALAVGNTYTYEIGHVKAVGSGQYVTLKGRFTAYP